MKREVFFSTVAKVLAHRGHMIDRKLREAEDQQTWNHFRNMFILKASAPVDLAAASTFKQHAGPTDEPQIKTLLH